MAFGYPLGVYEAGSSIFPRGSPWGWVPIHMGSWEVAFKGGHGDPILTKNCIKIEDIIV